MKLGRFDRAAEALWLAAERPVRWAAAAVLHRIWIPTCLALQVVGCASTPTQNVSWTSEGPHHFHAARLSVDLDRSTSVRLTVPGVPARWLVPNLYVPTEEPLRPGFWDDNPETPGLDAELSVIVTNSQNAHMFKLSGTMKYWNWGGTLGEPRLRWHQVLDLGPTDEAFEVLVRVDRPSSKPVTVQFELEATELVISERPPNKGLQLTTDSWAFLNSVAFWRRGSAAWR